MLKLNRQGVNSITLSINGVKKTFLWDADGIDLEGWAHTRENDIVMTLTNNLRNLLGPHHLSEGGCHRVTPKSFHKEASVWASGEDVCGFNENYCFVKLGI